MRLHVQVVQLSEYSQQLVQQLNDSQQQLQNLTAQHSAVLAEVHTLRELVATVEHARDNIAQEASVEAASKEIHSKVVSACNTDMWPKLSCVLTCVFVGHL
jgi:phage shock protein A